MYRYKVSLHKFILQPVSYNCNYGRSLPSTNSGKMIHRVSTISASFRGWYRVCYRS